MEKNIDALGVAKTALIIFMFAGNFIAVMNESTFVASLQALGIVYFIGLLLYEIPYTRKNIPILWKRIKYFFSRKKIKVTIIDNTDLKMQTLTFTLGHWEAAQKAKLNNVPASELIALELTDQFYIWASENPGSIREISQGHKSKFEFIFFIAPRIV